MSLIKEMQAQIYCVGTLSELGFYLDYVESQSFSKYLNAARACARSTAARNWLS